MLPHPPHHNRILGTMKLALLSLLAALLSMTAVVHAQGMQAESHAHALDEALMHLNDTAAAGQRNR